MIRIISICIFHILIFGCNSNINNCDSELIPQELICDKSIVNKRIITFDMSQLTMDSLRHITDYESYTESQEYWNKNVKVKIQAILEPPKWDTILYREIRYRIEDLSLSTLKKPMNFFQNKFINGVWAEIDNDGINYKLFEGGNYEDKLIIRITLSQKDEIISNACFDKILNSIKFKSL